MAFEIVAALIGLAVTIGMFFIGRARSDNSVKPFLATERRQAAYAVALTGVACFTVLLMLDAIAHLAS